MKKCEWAKTSVEYLGFTISDGKIAMQERIVKAVQEWPQPQCIKDVQGFLGLANYYRRFIY